jgi:hypothetical protein
MLRLVMAGALALALGACASVTRGTSEAVVFESEPAAATMTSKLMGPCADEERCKISKDDRYAMADEGNKGPPSCITPCTIVLPRSQEFEVTFAKAGYEPRTVNLVTNVRPGGATGVAGNAIVGGLIGVAVDTGTGAALAHCPNPLKVTLRRIGSREPMLPFDQKCAPPPITSEGMPQYKATDGSE